MFEHPWYVVIVGCVAIIALLALSAADPPGPTWQQRINAACASHRGVQDYDGWNDLATCRDGSVQGF